MASEVEVIDLLSDSDDDAKPPAAAVADAATTRDESSRKLPASSYESRSGVQAAGVQVLSQSQSSEPAYDSDDSDSSLMNSKPVFSKKPTVTTPISATAPTNVTPTSTVSLKSPPSHAKMSANSTEEENETPFEYPPPLLPNSKTYEDLRPKYILSFWQCARRCVQNSYDAKKLDLLTRKVVLLSLTPYPVRSLEEYCFSRGVGGCCGSSNANKASRLNEIQFQLEEGGLESRVIRVTRPNETKKYFSIAEACLVAMLTEIEHRLVQKDIDPRVLNVTDDTSLQGMLSDKDLWISVQDLIPATDALLRPECPGRLTRRWADDNGAAHYNQSNTKSAAFLQIRKLETPHKELGDNDVARIKRHTRRGTILFELTFVGFRSAQMILERQLPSPLGYYRCSRIQRVSQVPAGYKDLCIAVDFREGGGPKIALHEMCNRLESTRVPFIVTPLGVGDYMFFTRGPSGNLDFVCPILVERKSIEDIAKSIDDGRWLSQKDRMYKAQYVFGYDNSRMVYIIEGNTKRQEVTGGFVGNRAYGLQSADIEREIASLESEGFEVMRTSSRDHSMLGLARWAKKVAADVVAGKLTAQYTYARFTRALNNVPQGIDFSHLAKQAMERKAQASVAVATAKRARTEIDYDSDIEVLEQSSSSQNNATGRRTLTSELSEKPAARASPSKKAKKDGKATSKYSDLSKNQLKQKCAEYGLTQSGNKPDLIARLNGPHPPELWLQRKRAGEKVPRRHDESGAALLVALYLHEKDAGDNDRGLTKDELIAKADELQISEYSILTPGPGPHLYTGWSSMTPMQQGDPPLVKFKQGRFKLTRNSDIAGYPVAEAFHKWCHRWNNCQCGAVDVE